VWIEIRGPRDGDTSGGGGGATTGCRRRWVPTKFPNFLNQSPVDPDIHVTPMPPRPGPAYVAYYVYCGADYITSVWLLPSAFAPAAAAVDVRAIAEQLVRDLPYPDAFIHISPDARGLTGLESWCSVSWSFGDATPTQTGTLGQATPARSDVAHTYEQRSNVTPLSVRATVRLDVRYRVDAEPWQSLDPVFRTAARGYPVAESRAALVPSR
jgi:hypothetical protein